MGYTGAGDQFLTTRRKRLDFGTSAKLGIIIKWKFTNSGDEAQMVILNPSDSPSVPARVVKDGNIAYEVGAADLNCAVNINTVEKALAWLKRNPTEVLYVRISTNNADQFDQQFRLIKRVFGKPDEERIIYFKQSAFQQKDIIYVTEEFELSADIELQTIIPGYVAEGTPTVTTMEFNYGASVSLHAALENKKEDAMQDPSVMSNKNAFQPDKQ